MGGMPSKSLLPGLDFSPTPTEMRVSVSENFKFYGGSAFLLFKILKIER
jgi:hypothetical protein